MTELILEMIEANRTTMERMGAFHEVIITRFAEIAVKAGADPVTTFWQMKERFGMGF